MAQDLSELFVDKQVFIHEGGHYVPGKKHIYNEFIIKMLNEKQETLSKNIE